MLSVLTAVAGLALTPPQTDTTIAVQQGTRLKVENFGGEIAVRTWSEPRVRIEASHSSRDRVEIISRGSVLRVQSEGRRGPSHMVEYRIAVPVWMSMDLSGVYTDVTVEGSQGDVSVETVEGDVTLSGGSGEINLQSIEGAIVVSGARGRLQVHSVDGNIDITNTAAEISAESVDGDVMITGAESGAVDANTVDGSIVYTGTIRDGGRYTLSTHDGTITLGVPERANATVTVRSFDGHFDPSFPVQVTSTNPRRFSFTLGTGSARIELETFDGEILLRRPAEVRVPAARERHVPHPQPMQRPDHEYEY